MFDPMTDVPASDEQVHIALQRDDELLTKNLRGLYRCFRAEGETVREAYRMTLEVHVEVYGKEQRRRREVDHGA